MPDTPSSAISTSHTPIGPELAYATFACALAVGIGALAERFTGFSDQSLIFITAVVLASVRTRMSVAIYAAVMCFLAYNFFFIHPRYSFYIAGGSGVVTVFMFLGAALLCSHLASRLRSKLIEVQQAGYRTEVMMALSQHLATSLAEGDIADAAMTALHAVTGAAVIFVQVDDSSHRLGEPRVLPAGLQFEPLTRMGADACLDAVGNGADPRPRRMDFGWWCFPLVAGESRLGVICLRFAEPLSSIPAPLDALSQLMIQGIAQALARAKLSTQLEASRVRAETERLRAALLSSVSHDLRSPLSTIIGSAESLKLFSDRLSADDRATLAADIVSEGLRLDRYIQNLLDMTRLGQGGPALQREWVGIDEICGAVMPRLRRSNPDHRVNLQLGPKPELLYVNPGLMEQALFNLLENAAKFSLPDRPLTLRSFRNGDEMIIDVTDQGPGISEEARSRVFDMFYSVEQGDRSPPGTGLGLTIVQGVVAAHGGWIEALPGDEGIGTCMRIRLPLHAAPAQSRDSA